jgi:hypothetical protein
MTRSRSDKRKVGSEDLKNLAGDRISGRKASTPGRKNSDHRIATENEL